MTPQQGQGLPTENTVVETAQSHQGFVDAYPKLRVRKESNDGLSFEQKVGETEPQKSVAMYPQIKVLQDISDELLLDEEASVSSGNSESPTDPDEENVTSSSEYNSVSEQSLEGSPLRNNYVQHQYVSDRPIAVEMDASSASVRKADMVEFEDEFMESSSSITSEANSKCKVPSLEEDGYVTYTQCRFNDVNRISASSSQVRETEAHHSRQTSDKVLQALVISDTDHIVIAAPFKSVNEVVFKFGENVDWKANRVQTMEKQRVIEEKLENMHHEIQWFRKQFEAAEGDKARVLKALNRSKRLIEELNLYLGRAVVEEYQAKQDSELASLRVVEMERGIADEASFAAKAQFEVARERHDAALSELATLKQELITVQNDFATLVIEKDLAVEKAEEALSASKEIEKTVEELTIELFATRGSLEYAHAAHLEAEEHKIGAAMALEQDTLNWEKELKQAEEEFEKLDQKILSAKDLKSKLDTASAFLRDLNFELAAYMDSKLNQETEEHSDGNVVGQQKKTQCDIQIAVSLAKKNLEEVKLNIEKTTDEIRSLKVAATSLKSQLETEKTALATLEQREGMASVAVASIEAELNRTINEIAMVQVKEREVREKMVELPKKLQKAAEEADQAKSLAHAAHEELRKAQKEVEHAKAGSSTVQSRLLAAQKEIEASKASENIAVASISAQQESEAAQTVNNDHTPSGVTLLLEEYYELSKQAQDAEEKANKRVADSLSLVEIAKESELQNLSKLEKVISELATQKNTLEFAKEEADKANEGKMGIEQKLRKWRAEHEQRRKAGESIPGAIFPSTSLRASSEGIKEEVIENRKPQTSFEVRKQANYLDHTKSDSFSDVKMLKKKKKYSRFFKFLSRKKKNPQSLQSSSTIS